MPVFEYQCQECSNDFQKLLFNRSAKVSCPGCGAKDVKRRPSTFGMSGVEKQTGSSSSCGSCTSHSCTSCSCH